MIFGQSALEGFWSRFESFYKTRILEMGISNLWVSCDLGLIPEVIDKKTLRRLELNAK